MNRNSHTSFSVSLCFFHIDATCHAVEFINFLLPILLINDFQFPPNFRGHSAKAHKYIFFMCQMWLRLFFCMMILSNLFFIFCNFSSINSRVKKKTSYRLKVSSVFILSASEKYIVSKSIPPNLMWENCFGIIKSSIKKFSFFMMECLVEGKFENRDQIAILMNLIWFFCHLN